MHIIIAILTAAGGLFWALYRLQNSGVDLNSFNPFFWARRRKWEKQLGTKPLHRIESSMEAAAVLVVAMAELEGIVTREHKAEIIDLFVSEFGIANTAAVEMYGASSHLLKGVSNIVAEVGHILQPTKHQYEALHKNSLVMMLSQVSKAESEPSKIQLEYIDAVRRELSEVDTRPKKW